MKKSVLPQPKRRAAASFPQHGGPLPRIGIGQAVEIAVGELAGARGTIVNAGQDSRWLIKLDGLAGVLLSIRPEAIRLLPARRK
jgi:hypothetical protein